MNAREVNAIARLAKRQVVARFGGSDESPMVRVTCLKRPEIVALVRSLREWKPEIANADVRVVVTAEAPWEELTPEEIVPRDDLTPTTLRNLRGVGVVLIEGDDYTDRQSWQSVRPISDASLLDDVESRRALVELCWRDGEVPGVLTQVLEEVHESVRAIQPDLSHVRRWIAFVDAVCDELGSTSGAVDAGAVWRAVGTALPKTGLFPDDALGALAPTDRKRRLAKNAKYSHRLLFEGDDHWRDALQERLADVVFTDLQGDPEPNANVIRAALGRLVGADGADEQSNVLYRHWLQLAESKKERKGLGTRIREHLTANHPELLEEYDGLEVADGIDAGNAEDAHKLLEAIPADESEAIGTKLTRKQKSALERMANPRAPTSRTPLAELLRVIADMVSEREAVTEASAEQEAVSIRIEPRKAPDEAEHSRAAFAWLFGPTLQSLSEKAESSTSLDVDPILTNHSALAELEKAEPTEDEEIDGRFATLELRLFWSDGIGLERRVDWNPEQTPGLVAMYRLAKSADVVWWDPGSDVGFDMWLESALQIAPMLGGRVAEADAPGIVQDWYAKRADALSALAANGLRREEIGSLVDAYDALLRRLRDEYVPAGAGRPEVEQILRSDIFVGQEGVVLTATHPLRLRWIRAYLERLENLLVHALAGELVTNPVNPDQFFSEMLSLSPQAQPAALFHGEQLHVAVREQDWHEIFAPLKDERGERRDWLADLDEGAIDDVADTVGRYLAAYPHKTDGLHVLYVARRHGARGLHRLITHIKKRVKDASASLELTLCVDPEEIRAVEEVLQDFDDADHREYSDRPPVRVNLRPWLDPARSLPDVTEIPAVVDIAVVPNLFGASTRTHDGTRDSRTQQSTFDPLLDEPTRLEAVGAGDAPSAAVSRVLFPDGRDELLEAWSTVTTRQFRGSPVSDAPNEYDIDHVTIQVSLDKNREFFDALHACAHWVITVDAFVGREQIEALKDGPDVIQVKTGVGANGAYRMVVSSSAGRPFVEARVARRLSQQIDASALPDSEAIARTIYDRARLLVPGIVLRSLGLGRTAAEMVGLVLARARVEQKYPIGGFEHGFQTWLSLDEHVDWSGGHQSPRADLARIAGWLDAEGNFHIRVDVVEAKMRTQFALGRAEGQLNRSIELFRAALGGDADQTNKYDDAAMWRRLIWRAIEQTSAAADGTPAATHVLTREGPRIGLDEELRKHLREGDMVVDAVDGILVSMTDAIEGEDGRTPAGHRWLKITLEEVRRELIRLRSDNAYPIGRNTPALTSSTNQVATTSTVEAGEKLDESGSKPQTAEPFEVVPRLHRGGRSPAALRRMQDLIDALHSRDVEVSAAGSDDALEGPGFFLLRIKLATGFRPNHVLGLTNDLQYELGLAAGQVPRIYVDSRTMVVELPKREDERYYVGAEELWRRMEWSTDRLCAPLGVDVSDKVIEVDFSSSRSPHLLIGGMTGGGKSVALETLLLGLVKHYGPERLELRIIDPKGNEFTQFEDMPHLTEPPGMDAEDAIEMLERTCDEMDGRYKAMKKLGTSLKKRIPDIATYNENVPEETRLKWIVVVLDEFADLTADKDNKKKIEALLQRIAQKARACGIHAIVATQKPSVEVINSTTRSNLGAQLALRVRSATDSRVIMEAPGAESLAGNGDAFLRLSGEEPIRLQCGKV